VEARVCGAKTVPQQGNQNIARHRKEIVIRRSYVTITKPVKRRLMEGEKRQPHVHILIVSHQGKPIIMYPTLPWLLAGGIKPPSCPNDADHQTNATPQAASRKSHEQFVGEPRAKTTPIPHV
jgi:hypothetical protein